MLAQIGQFILSLTLLVLIHEFGHFLFAKLFGVRVEKFYIFFNPGFSLYKTKIGETEFGIGWLPLGGYVKLAGIIDESLDKSHIGTEPKPWEFRAKPAWQRLLIMLGGIIMNIILAFIIYIGMLYAWGTNYLPAKEVNQIMVDSLGQQIGLRNGDKIISVNDQGLPKRYRDIFVNLLLTDPHSITVVRDGDTVRIVLTNDDIAKLIKHVPVFTPRIPVVIGGFADNSPAKQAGLQVGDSVIAINGQPITYFDQGKRILKQLGDTTVQVTVLRDGKTYTYTVKLQNGKLGVFIDTDLSKYYPIETEHYSLLRAIPAGINLTLKQFANYIKQLKLIFNPHTEAYKSVGSFIAIGNLFPKSWDWVSFWNLTAFLSIVFAIMNLIPIPGLDGGHALFALWEMITGKKPSDKVLEIAQIIGMIILFLLLALALWNDFTNYIFKK